jgi:hypothetical protein
MPINPATMREQVYPSSEDIETFKNFDLSQAAKDTYNERMTDKHYSVLFGMVNAIEEEKQKTATAKQSVLTQLNDHLTGAIEKAPSVALWLSELIQNAMDAKWYDGSGVSKITIDFSKTEIGFRHDGRPPQHLGYNKSELIKMVESGSTKRSDLNSEGRFGIGFKYWTYHFSNVVLSADGWKIGWDEKMNLSDIEQSDVQNGMELIFRGPKDKCSELLRKFENSLETLFDGGLMRLIEGLAVEDSPIILSVCSNGKEQFKLDHKVLNESFTITEQGAQRPVDFFTIENNLTLPDGLDLDTYIPKSLVAVDVKQFFEHSEPTHYAEQRLIEALYKEFEHIENHAIEEILTQEAASSGLEWNSHENILYSATQQIKLLKSICMFDLTPEIGAHHMMYSMFAIEKDHQRNNRAKDRKKHRIFVKGTYKVNQERTSLGAFNQRNQAISYAQFHSGIILMHLLSIPSFRKKYGISSKIHYEILSNFEKAWIDDEFQNLVRGILDERD